MAKFNDQTLIALISDFQSQFTTAADAHSLFSGILDHFLRLTGSEFGFIAEVLQRDTGESYLQTRAITDISWNEESRKIFDRSVNQGLEFSNLDTLYGRVVSSAQAVFSNVLADPRRSGLPPGHPPLNAFAGLPFFCGERLVGMVALANRPGGYEEDLGEQLRPLLDTCAILIEAGKGRLLLNSQRQLFEAQRLAHLGNWELDLVSGELHWSDEVYRIFGYQPGEFAASYEAFLEAVHPEDRERVNKAYTESVANRTSYDIEHRLLLRDGTLKYVNERCQTFYDDDGRPLRSIGTIQDITERKEVENALHHEITQRNRIERALQEVAAAVSSSTGTEFFRMLVRQLTRVLDADIALIGEVCGEAFERVETVAACVDGEIVENFSYSLSATPCRKVAEQGVCFYPENIRDLFPDDYLLMEMNVESYLGAPLLDMEGHVLGLVVVMKCAPMKDRQPTESILRIFAARIAAELQHKKTLEKIRGLETFPAENPGPVLRIRGDGVILYANQGSRPLLEHWGCQKGQTVPVAFLRKCISCLAENCPLELDLAFGEHEYSLLLAPNIENYHVNVYGRDISERRQAQAQMVKLSSALEQIADSVIITNRQGVIEYVNPAFEATTGYSREEAIGNKPSLVKSGRHGPEFYQQLWRTILRGEIYRDMFINRKKDGALYYEEKTITPLKDSAGGISHFVSTGKDITRRMEAEERLHHLAYHDMLTNLPNRALFMDRIEHAMSRRRGGTQRLALLFLDLDRFKNINDTLGHDVGDRLLQTIALRIMQCVREGDTVARFGGDEFAILLEDVASSDAVGQVARKFIEVIEKPIEVEGHELFATASIGISFFPDDADNANILLKNADTAMYRAKDTGRNTYQFYSREMGTKAFERLSLETSLRHALDRGEFLLHYQPQIDIQSGRIIGVESLIRWQHPELGLVQPLKFIPLLEETGLIVPVGEWILETACEQLKSWHEVHGVLPRLSINLSGRQFFDPGLKMQLDLLLRKSGLEPHVLELEITETVLMQNDRATRENLGALQELGLRLSIDDFGTGYSSLSYLKRFPIDTLKIDRSFIRDLTIDPDDAAIVSAIIVMAHSLKLEVIAEGVETREQLDFLRAKQCDAMQGYLFSKPVSTQELGRLLDLE